MKNKRITLPIFITPMNKLVFGLFIWTIATILYLASNHNHLTPPVLLDMSAIDSAIPFVPETYWVYVSEYILFGSVFVLCKNLVELNKYFYSFLALQIISNIIFFAWPTTYPRDLFPLPANLDPITTYMFGALRQTDSPANCCPSLHVSSVYLSSFVFLRERKKLYFFFAWATAVAVTTLTTKQHYLIDVVAGLAFAIVFYYVFHRFVNYVDVRPAISKAVNSALDRWGPGKAVVGFFKLRKGQDG